MRTEKEIDKIIANVKATLAIEGLQPSKRSEELSRMYLRGEISSEEVIKKITENILKKYKKEGV